MRAVSEVLVLLIRVYQWTIRPFIGANCRFEPSCSHYAVDALRLHGPARGALLSAKRVLRCNPWHPGGYDPAPSCRCHAPGDAARHNSKALIS